MINPFRRLYFIGESVVFFPPPFFTLLLFFPLLSFDGKRNGKNDFTTIIVIIRLANKREPLRKVATSLIGIIIVLSIIEINNNKLVKATNRQPSK